MSRDQHTKYTVRVSDPNGGAVVQTIEQFKFLQISRQLNRPGYYQLVFDGVRSPDVVDDTELDYQLDFIRNGRLFDNNPVTEFTALNRTWVRAQFRSGIVQHSLFGRGLEDLLNRRIIATPADVVADLSGPIVCGGVYNAPVDLVMWASTRLHAGADALVGNSRVRSGVTQGLNVVVPAIGLGANWQGDTAWRNLLDLLKDLSDWSWANSPIPFDFGIDSLGPGAYNFVVYNDGRGLDKTIGNLAGNDEVVFTADNGNFLDVWLSRARSEEINRVYALGDGDAAARDIEVAQDLDTTPIIHGGNGTDSSNWNLIEAARSAPSNTVGAQLQTFGEQELAKNAAPPTAVFVPRQQIGSVYGVDYELGDRVSVIHEGIRVDVRITAVEIFVSGDGTENIQLTTEVARNGSPNISFFSFDDSLASEFVRASATKSEVELNRKALRELQRQFEYEITR